MDERVMMQLHWWNQIVSGASTVKHDLMMFAHRAELKRGMAEIN